MPYAYGGSAGGPWWWPGSWAGECMDFSSYSGSNLFDPGWQKISLTYFSCPSRVNPPKLQYYDVVSYGMNISMGMTLWSRPYRQITDVVYTDKTLFQIDVEGNGTGDSAQYYLTGQWWGNYDPRHLDAANVLYIDNHVSPGKDIPIVNTNDFIWDF